MTKCQHPSDFRFCCTTKQDVFLNLTKPRLFDSVNNSPEALPGLHVPRHIGQSLNILVQTGTKKVDGLRNVYQSHVLSSHCVNFFALPHHSNTENSCQHVAEVKTTQGARERSINTSLYALFLRSNQTLKSSSCPSLHLDSQILCDYY